MRNFIGHLKNIFTHKWWVFYYACKLGIPWQGITHDLSKFSWKELKESIKYYQGNKSPIPIAKNENGYSEAWQHHKGVNKHHYEYWIDNRDNLIVLIPIPYKYVLEMIADWLGAFRTYRGYENLKEEYDWWIESKKNYKLMNSFTKMFITIMLQHFMGKDNLDTNDIFIQRIKYTYEVCLKQKIEYINIDG